MLLSAVAGGLLLGEAASKAAQILLPILAQYGPEAFRKAVELWHARDPKLEDWLSLTSLVEEPKKP